MDTPEPSLGLRLVDSDELIQELDAHSKTCEVAKRLALERDGLRRRIATLRLLYAEVVFAQQDQMRTDLIVAGWEEFRVNMWRDPLGKIYRGCAAAWHAMRGMGLQ